MGEKKEAYDFKAGEVLLINKPLTWTSFDVVNKVRYKLKHALKVKKIKVGHAGTLDPLATGLLIVCTGKATKTIESIQSEEKVYTGHIELGKTTPSYDLETAFDQEFEIEPWTLEDVQNAANNLTGELMQTPPVFSAKKVDGKTAYIAARQGKEVKLRKAPVRVEYFKIIDFTNNIAQFEIKCSKGTYIRSLAHDLGKELSNGAYLKSLCRTQSGDFKLEDAFEIDEAIDLIEEYAHPSKDIN